MARTTLIRTILIACVGLSSAPAAAKQDFGDQLRRWVDNEVAGLSRQIVEADFPVRVHNMFVTATESNLGFISKADVQLRGLEEIMRNNLVVISPQGVRAALDLQANAFEVQAQLTRLQDEFQNTRSRLELLSSEDLNSLFFRSGAYNVGYAGVLASFADVTKGEPNTFSGRYPGLTLTVATSDDGKTKVSLTSPRGDLSAVSAVGIGRQLAVAYGANATTANVWASMILLWYSFWELHESSEEFKRQSVTFEEAIADFPKKTMGVPEQLAFFKETWSAVGVIYKPVIDQVRVNNKLVEDRLKTALAWNAARLTLSRKLVTQEKLRAAVSGDLVLPADQRIFSAVKNQAALSDLTKLEGYTKLLSVQLESACGNVEGLNLAEEYARSGLELAQLSRAVSDRPAFAPIKSKSDALTMQFKPEAFDIRKTASEIGSRRCGPKIAVALPRSKPSRNDTFSIAIRADQVVPVAAAIDGGMSYCYTNASGYGCEQRTSPEPGFGGRFPPVTGDPVLSSPGDGGYVDRQPSATNATDAATRQIETRIHALSDQKAKIEVEQPQWLTKNLSSLEISGSTQSAALVKEGALVQQYLARNDAALLATKTAIASFVNGPLTSISVSKLSRDTDIEAVSPKNIPLSLARDAGPILDVLNPREISPVSASLRDVERIRFNDEMELVERRVEGAGAAKPDPVFVDGSAFQRLRDYGKMSLAMADRLFDEKQKMTPLQASRVDGAIDGALLNVKAARYYAWGYEAPRFIYDADVLDWKQMKTHMVDTISEFISCNAKNKGYEDISKTPCNVMVGTALNRLYGMNDFGGPKSFLRANDIAKYVATSPDWTLVGSALDQTSLDDAGMLAALGRPVISVWANPTGDSGHVNIILPGIPYEQASDELRRKWGDLRLPRVINFHVCGPGCDLTMDDLTYSDGTIDRAYKRLSSNALKNVLIYVRDRKSP